MESDAPSDRELPRAVGFARPAWLTDALLLELAFVSAVTVAALLMRLWNLSSLPHGLHGDEAATGLDARKILGGESIFPYTASALGQPSGPMYWAAIWAKLLGSTIVAVRLPMVLLGTGTVILGYIAFRILFGRPVAWAGAVLLAFSSWLVFYNRTGFTASAMPFTEMASLVAVAIALRKRHPLWFAGAGVVVGAGIYGYFGYPLFAVALAMWMIAHWLIERPRPLWTHLRNIAVMALTALLLIVPMWPYFNGKAEQNGRTVGYRHDRDVFALSHTPEYEASGAAHHAKMYLDNARHVLAVLARGGRPDASDGSGEQAALDPLLLALTLAGTALCGALAVSRRRAAYLLPLIIAPIVLIGPFWSAGGIDRRSLGILPFAVLPAAVLLGSVWEWLASRGRHELATAIVAILLVAYAGINIHRYFSKTPDTYNVLFTYAPELTNAATLIRQQDSDVHVYFIAARWSAGYETMAYLAPDRKLGDGTLEDRSKEFSGATNYSDIDRTRRSLIVLMNNYLQDSEKVAALYPDATRLIGESVDHTPSFVAFSIPPRRATAPQ